MTNQSKLSKYIYTVAADYGKYTVDGYTLDLNDLPDYEINKLLLLKLEGTGREMESVFFSNIDSTDVESSFIRMLSNESQETRNEFVKSILKNALENFSDELQQLINEACVDFEYDNNIQHRRYIHINRNTGEREWRNL